MNKEHIFKASLTWKQPLIAQEITERNYSKSHTIQAEGKPELAISAAKAFKGDPELYNPEDLLLSSLMSCHMMSYLYCCQQHQIEVLSYTDNAEATLQTASDGSGRITQVVLRPEVTIKNQDQVDLANALHQKANQLCFIANSCNFPVLHEATCRIA
jgi:organic hydroperoxide reductase OsmC/OhrA